MKYPSKRLLVLCLLALASTAPALRAADEVATEAKKEHRPKGNPGETMKKELGLTDAQAEQMKTIHADTEAQMKALRENKTLSMEEKKAAKMKIQEATKAKIDAILSPEQKAKFDKMRENMKEHRKDRHPGKDGKDGAGEKGEKHSKPGVQ